MRTSVAPLPLVALLALSLAARGQGQVAKAPPLDRVNLDTTCAPCNDFARFANGGWLDRTQIPGDQPAWGGFSELQEANYATLHDVLDSAASAARSTTDPDTRRLGLYFGTCMDSARAEADGATPLAPELARIAAVKARPDIRAYAARLSRWQISAPFNFHATPDAKNSARVIGEVYQGGLGLPDRDYYTRSDSASVALRDQYVEHVTRMLRLLGDDSLHASRSAATVLRIETALAQASMTQVEQRDPDSTYHLTRLADLQRMTPALSWTAWFNGLGLVGVTEINVAQPKFLRTVDSLIARAPLAEWRTYFRWQLLTKSAALLSSPFVAENFRFKSGILTGVTEQRPRWKRCLDRTDEALGEILGQAYVRQRFTPEAKARALEMVHNIQAEFRRRLAALAWMSDATKAKAYTKLDAIINKIGYPDHWRDYSALELGPGSFLANAHRAAEFESARDFRKIGKPLDRTEWGMSPPTVNAYYNPNINEIVFPAGIMQPPFFDPDADDAVNYGGMGGVIGHELTHGFDDEGRKFDARGNLSAWWSDEDAKEFTDRADVVVRQFDGYTAIDTLHVNGRLTLGENIADLGGLTIAYAAFRRTLEGKPEPAPIDSFSADQRFFLAWAQVFRSATRPEFSRLLATLDPHAPDQLRIIGPLSNLPEFARAFGCKAGDAMVRSEAERANIW